MKIKLTDEFVCKIEIDEEEYIGCHTINCYELKNLDCNNCNLFKRGLHGGYYPVEEVEDLLIKEEE